MQDITIHTLFVVVRVNSMFIILKSKKKKQEQNDNTKI